MSQKEYTPSPHDRGEDENSTQERLRWNHSELRREAKDLLTILRQTPQDFQQRVRLFELVEQILHLVPPYSDEDEQRDEQDRRKLAGHVEAAASRFQNDKKSRILE